MNGFERSAAKVEPACSDPHERAHPIEHSLETTKVQSTLRVPHFGLLEPTPGDRKRRHLALGASPAFEAIVICLMAWALTALPKKPEEVAFKEQVVMLHLAPTPPPVRRPPLLLKRPPIPPPPVAHLNAPPIVPETHRVEIQKPELERLKIPEAPKIELPQPPRTVIPAGFEAARTPAAPVKQVVMPRTGTFTPGSMAQATIKRPLREVQTGGFGAANGIPGDAADNHTNVAKLGTFDLPSGPGHGNGTGGAQGVRGVVASAGFGNAVGSGAGQNSASSGTIRQGGFGDVAIGSRAPETHAASSEGAIKPVTILSKPDPVYPEEARKLHLEGEVVLSVIFEASGKLDVLNVVSGLGHGMDEAAKRAAEQIRFKPAERDGRPVDSKALVHIIFQLAY